MILVALVINIVLLQQSSINLRDSSIAVSHKSKGQLPVAKTKPDDDKLAEVDDDQSVESEVLSHGGSNADLDDLELGQAIVSHTAKTVSSPATSPSCPNVASIQTDD